MTSVHRTALVALLALTSSAIVGAQDLKLYEDSLKKELLHRYIQSHSYDEAISILKEKKKPTKDELKLIYQLLRQKHTNGETIDSIKLQIAIVYKEHDEYDDAISLFTELTKSSINQTRNRAIIEVDRLLKKKKNMAWFNEYPVSPITDVLKPAAPFIFLGVLFGIVMLIRNSKKNKVRMDVIGDDFDSKKSFLSALQIMRNRIESNQTRTANNSAIIAPGPAAVLPHLEAAVNSNFHKLVNAVVPSTSLPLIGWLMNLGSNPLYKVFIVRQKLQATLRVDIQLKQGALILREWTQVVTEDNIFETELDIAYQIFVKISG